MVAGAKRRGRTHSHVISKVFIHRNPLIPLILIHLELKDAQKKKRQMKERYRQEENIANSMVIWNTEVLPNWESMLVSFSTLFLPNIYLKVHSVTFAFISPSMLEI